MSVSTDYSISLSNNKQKDIFQLAIEAAPNAMIVVDLAGKIVIANTQTEHMFGYSKDELIGNSIEMLLPPKSRDKHKHLREGFFKEQQARSMGEGRDLFGLRKDGGEVPLEIGLNPLHTTEQHLVLASVIDITERKRTEAKFIQVQKMESLGILAGGIAHDFNNLLTSILGYADLAMRDLPLASSSREYINQVIRGSHSAADLVKQLLAYSGKGFYEMQPIQLADIIEEIGHLLQVSISKKCVLQYRFEPGLPPIDADIAQIKQLAMNLIINASDAIGDRSGVIVISTGVMHCDKEYLSRTFNDGNTPEGLYVYMEISDTGCGMTAETIARIFGPFFTAKTVGRGLGLAAVHPVQAGKQPPPRRY